MEWGELDPVFGTVVLDSNGDGTLRFSPAGEQWRINNISVEVSTSIEEATATVYKRFVGPQYRHSGTYAGSSGDNNQIDEPIRLTDGEALWVVWEGGDPGATATAVLTGQKTVDSRGFRAR